MARSNSRAAAALVAALALLAPSGAVMGAEGGGLAIFVHVSPYGAGYGDMVTVDVEVRLWKDLADPDGIGMDATNYGADPELQRVALGQYRATFLIDKLTFPSGRIEMKVGASLGALSATEYEYYSFAPGPPWNSYSMAPRIGNLDEIGPYAGPGDVIRFEAWTYESGELKDYGEVSALLQMGILGQGGPETPIAVQHPQAGVYTVSVTVPSDITRPIDVSVYFRDNLTEHGGYPMAVSFGSASIMAYPLRATAFISNVTEHNATIHVIAGSEEGPVSGATVDIRALTRYEGEDACPGVSPLHGTTDARGLINLTYQCGSGVPREYTVNVSKGGATMPIRLITAPYEFGSDCFCPPNQFYVERLSKTWALRPGDQAHLTFRAWHHVNPLPNTTLAPFAWRQGSALSTPLANVTTDATGNFSIDYSIPSDWTPADMLYLGFINQSGQSFRTSVYFGWYSPQFPSKLQLDVSPVNASSGPAGARRQVEVRATFTGQGNLNGTHLRVEFWPGTDMFGSWYSGGPALSYLLPRNGSVFGGVLTVNDSFPAVAGILTVVVVNAQNTSLAESYYFPHNSSALTWPSPLEPGASPAPGSPGQEPTPGTAPNHDPPTYLGQDSMMALLLAVAVAAAAAITVLRRRARAPPAAPPR